MVHPTKLKHDLCVFWKLVIRDCVWEIRLRPTLAKPTLAILFDRLWPTLIDRLWPKLGPTLANLLFQYFPVFTTWKNKHPFGPCEAPKGVPPKGVLPKGGAPKGGAPKGGPRRVGGPKFRAFLSLSRHHFALFVSIWVSARGILVVFEAPGP